MAQKENKKKEEVNPLKDIISHAKEYGFVFPSSEIYDGLQSVYDYGQNGVALKNNLKNLWWRFMTQLHENIVGLDSSIFMHPLIWKASGHIDSFNDPMIDNKDSKKRYRVDTLLEDKASEYEKNGQKLEAQKLLSEMNEALEKEDFETLRNLIIQENILCSVSNTANWTEVRQFNLMFSTQMGSVAEESDNIYLRPETAQGIFVNFLNVQKTSRQQIPFGIAQIGKAFRNEIIARQFIFRMREFEQMEMQFFVAPGEEMKWYDYWKEKRLNFLKVIGIPAEKLKFKVHEKLAHYANAAVDIEFEFPFGFKEIEGIHSRTDFDLKSHQELSKVKMQYFDEERKEKYIPYVIETSIGADRLFLAILCNAYTLDKGVDAQGNEKERLYLKFHPLIAPTQIAVFPLIKRQGLPEKAREIFELLRYDYRTVYEDRGAIGKNYTRQDLVGTPYCITVDHQTLEDNTVTVRERDTTEQIRLSVTELESFFREKYALKTLLEQMK